jgi:hypothetical protein
MFEIGLFAIGEFARGCRICSCFSFAWYGSLHSVSRDPAAKIVADRVSIRFFIPVQLVKDLSLLSSVQGRPNLLGTTPEYLTCIVKAGY